MQSSSAVHSWWGQCFLGRSVLVSALQLQHILLPGTPLPKIQQSPFSFHSGVGKQTIRKICVSLEADTEGGQSRAGGGSTTCNDPSITLALQIGTDQVLIHLICFPFLMSLNLPCPLMFCAMRNCSRVSLWAHGCGFSAGVPPPQHSQTTHNSSFCYGKERGAAECAA